MTHYDTLKVAHDAPEAVIRAAYKTLMQKYHPDKFEGDPEFALELSKKLLQAYLVLIDPDLRAR